MSTTTKRTISPTDTVNAVLGRYPETQPVFHRHRIDSCCGGALTLETVAERHGLDLAALLDELRA